MKNIMVFDIGGTWFRCGVFEPHQRKVLWIEKFHINQDLSSLNSLDKMELIISNIIIHIIAYEKKHSFDKVVISFGACLNHNTGEIYYSSPIFGSEMIEMNLQEHLRNIIPYKTIFVINDISALCYAYDALEYTKEFSHIVALTLSSGIALRRYDARLKKIFFDSHFGIQGEVGHSIVPNPYYKGIDLPFCDCGKQGHFSSFSSGNGLDKIFDYYQKHIPDFHESQLNKLYKQSGISSLALRDALLKNDNCFFSDQLLNVVAYPIAYVIAMLFYMCPEIEQVFISGGVAVSLGYFLREKIIEFLPNLSYVYDKTFFENKITFIQEEQNMGLIGAGHYLSISPDLS